MDARRQHQGMHAPLQSQQFPPLLQQGGGQPPRLPLPLPHPNVGYSPRPSSFSGPLAGQKRSHRSSDSGGFTKLFVSSLPRNISEDEVRDLFGGFGNVLEVIFLKDKKTGLPQGCCFIKYANVTDAERAIRALDNQRTLPGAPAPLQVKFADSERDHPGLLEHKLFVGSLNKQAGEQEIKEIFAPYGRVENVYLIRDDQRQSRGCAFVTFPEKEMAIAAISALNGIYKMAGCHQPIIVRFADPKRPRSGERERMGGAGLNYSPRSHQGGTGPNYNSHSHQGAGGPRGSGGLAMEAHGPALGWRQGGGAGGMGLLPQAGILPLEVPSSTPARKGPLENPNSAMGIRGGGLSSQGAPAISGPVSVSGISPQLSQQQGFKESPLHKPGQGFGQPLPLHQQPMQQSHHNQVQSIQGFSMLQSTDTRSQHHAPAGQYSSPQPGLPMYGQTPVALNQLQQQQPITTMSSQALQFQPMRQQDSQPNQQAQNAQPLQQVPQMLPLLSLPSQMQSQVVAKETPQQAYVQPLQMVNQPSLQPVSWQSSWSIPVQQQAIPVQQQAIPVQQQANPPQQQGYTLQQHTNSSQQQVVTSQQQAIPLVATPTLTSVPANLAPTVARCDWTEHTSPEGHKYYYNSSTGESRWEKPEEFAAFEKQQQQHQLAHPQQQQQQQQQQLTQQQQPQQVLQSQVQAHTQQLQSQQVNPQYQQQQLINHQPHLQVQQAAVQQVQPYHQQPQPQMQQLLQQPQSQQSLLQLPQLQQLQQQLQQSQPQLQQSQREAQFISSGLQFSQLPSGGAYQATQGYAQVQPASQTANGITNSSQLQQFTSNQQANGAPDLSRSAQWVPSIQQGVPSQDILWKAKPAGS